MMQQGNIDSLKQIRRNGWKKTYSFYLFSHEPSRQQAVSFSWGAILLGLYL